MGRLAPQSTGRLGRCPLAVGACCVLLAGAATAAAPFAALDPSPSVSTTRPGDAVWISLASSTHSAHMPGHEAAVGPPGHLVFLHAHCAMGGSGAPPHPVRAGLYLRNHPDQPDAYIVLHPMHWILRLTGAHVERFAVEVRIDAGTAIVGELVRPRVDWSAGKPGSDIALPAVAVVSALAGGTPIDVRAHGKNFGLEATFVPGEDARRAARLIQRHCPLP